MGEHFLSTLYSPNVHFSLHLTQTETKGGICWFCFFWYSDPLRFLFIFQKLRDNISHLIHLFSAIS